MSPIQQWKKGSLIAILLLCASALSAAETWSGYDEMPNPTLTTCMESMHAHQIQWNLFHLYTINIDNPGYIEPGGYNHSKNNKISVQTFYRWRSGPPQETGNSMDFFVEADCKGFFCLILPNGQIGYTRDGRFALNRNRKLIMRHGNLPVMSESGKEIILPPGQEIACSRAGVLFVDNNPVDKMKIMVFNDEKDMRDGIESINGCVFYLTKEIPPDPNPVYAVRQGFLEQQNVLKALIGDGLLFKYGNEASAKVAKMSTKTMTSAVQMANP